MRLSKITSAVLLTVVIVSCSGGNNAGLNPPTQQPSTQQNSIQPDARPHATLNVAGPIVDFISGGFTIKTGSSCPGGGDLHIFTNSSTKVDGPKPAAGENVRVYGEGSCSSSVAAISITTAVESKITVQGPIVNVFQQGFTIQTGSSCPGGGKLHVYTNSSTVLTGARPAVGEDATASGPGSCSSSVQASAVTTSGSVHAQTHLLTADYLGAPYGTSSISWASAAPYLNWAQTTTQDADAVSAAGIKTEYYTDPNDTSNDGDPLYTSNPATFALSCSGSRVTYEYNGKTFYLMNIGSPAMRALYASYVGSITATAHFNGMFEDQAGALNSPPYPCNYNNSTWIAYGQQLIQAAPSPIMVGGLEDLNGHNVSLTVGLLSASNAIGGNYEHCYSDDGTPKMHSWVWQAMEDTELEVGQQGKLFRCQLRNDGNAGDNTDARIYALASFLLTYNPSTSILWEEFSTPSGLHVMPESGLVALSPATNPSTLSSLQQSGGAYARQFNQCYYRGSSIGACAVVVNPNYNSVPFPFTQYHHTLYLSGDGVLDGGKLYTSGGAPSSSLPAEEAAIVFQ
ncbi:MAG: hypothetical protein JO092_06100 [Candidatus Eremiobacteraeota bacterium]|nr:hypothetical protein [Candidatus Eremiobacteraeota bacterium]